MRALLGVITALALAGCDDDPCDYPLEVVDAETGAVIPDAEVVVAFNAWGRRYEVDALPAGEYRLWARAPGYRQITEAVALPYHYYADYGDDAPSSGCPNDPYVVALERRR